MDTTISKVFLNIPSLLMAKIIISTETITGGTDNALIIFAMRSLLSMHYTSCTTGLMLQIVTSIRAFFNQKASFITYFYNFHMT